MADRNLDFDPTVTTATPKLPDNGVLSGASDLADQVATISANSKALNGVMQSSLMFRQADAQFRQQAASNPDDPQAMADLQANRAKIMSTVGQQIPAIAQREYMTRMMSVAENGDKLNSLWGIQQQVKNSEADLAMANDTDQKQAAMAGRQFGMDGADMSHLGAVMDFETAKQAVADHLTPILGQPRTEAALKDFSSNHVKAFVSGLAEVNPQAAALMLQQDNISEHFTPTEIGNMAQVIKKTEKQQEIIKSYTTTKNDGGLLDLVNDPNSGYADKITQIQRGMGTGDISTKNGNAAIKILHSNQTVDAITDKPVMDGIIRQTVALNENAALKSPDYLLGAQDINSQILNATANGSLTQDDASKLSKDVNTRMEKKMSVAAYDIRPSLNSDALAKFDQLPLQYRAQATQQLFYATHGKDNDITPQMAGNIADNIVGKINDQRRQDALKTIAGVPQADSDFLKTIPNANPATIQATAQKHGISPQQVIQQLRIQAAQAARARLNQVKSIKGSSRVDDDEAEPVTLSRTKDTDTDNDAMDAEALQ